MGRILYIFPHPDDESFGPGPVLAAQRRAGHEVYLLTLTRGEATSQRQKYGYSKSDMGRQRYREMQAVAETLDLTDLTVLDIPDGGMAEMNPLDLEAAVRRHVEAVQPNVVVTYAVHGISGHPDHLVGHNVVKRVYCDLRQNGAPYLQRLAFFTLPKEGRPGRPAHLRGSAPEQVDCIVRPQAPDFEKGHAALACYETYQDVVQAHRPLDEVEANGAHFEFFQETVSPPAADLFAGL